MGAASGAQSPAIKQVLTPKNSGVLWRWSDLLPLQLVAVHYTLVGNTIGYSLIVYILVFATLDVFNMYRQSPGYIQDRVWRFVLKLNLYVSRNCIFYNGSSRQFFFFCPSDNWSFKIFGVIGPRIINKASLQTSYS
ncbi:hypothetical protein GDO81_021296 [Engystomops pustulosus]|uniref:Uncharacterized protein n=1 Tax=Engystomops pustulosus TaxID=76066 RepID=A0AAV6ZF86_ENGPU|nr:hypothetical protein GDO81_021296 [Engystomops pustulosus]